MIHYVHTKFCPILKGSGANFSELIWNDPNILRTRYLSNSPLDQWTTCFAGSVHSFIIVPRVIQKITLHSLPGFFTDKWK